MRSRPLLALVLLLGTACSRPPATQATAPAPAPQAPPPSSATLAAASEPAPAPVPASGDLKEGDFTVIAGGKPFDTPAGKVEVAEFFNYACPACFAFEPMFEAWRAKLPADVHVVHVPADFRSDFAVYARVYYAAELLGLADRTHEAVYRAIHDDHSLPGEQRTPPDANVIAGFYADHGTTRQAFLDAMDSFAVNTRLAQGHQFMAQSQIDGTPALVIDGRYRVNGTTFEDKLRIAGLLVERQRKAATGSH